MRRPALFPPSSHIRLASNLASWSSSLATNEAASLRTAGSRRLLGAAVFALIMGLAGRTNATQYPWVWQRLGVGCARAISVGPNGVPWILGCSQGQPNGVGPAWVYYLNTSSPPGSLLPHYQWVYDNFSALTLYVNLNGIPFATDTNGIVYSEAQINGDGDANYLLLPSGTWNRDSTGAMSAIAASASPLTLSYYKDGELFYPAEYFDTSIGQEVASTNIWGIGCVNGCYNGTPINDSGIWDTDMFYLFDEPNEALTWLELPGSATTVTMFTLPEGTAINGSDIEQVPWVLNTEGNVYWWSATDNDDTQYGEQGSWKRVATPESIKSITDGAILGQSGILYECATGNIFDAFCASGQASTPQQWTAMAGPYLEGNPNNPINIKQIALGGSISEAVVGGNPNSRINSPTVWAIDYSGNIYYSAQYQIAQ